MPFNLHRCCPACHIVRAQIVCQIYLKHRFVPVARHVVLKARSVIVLTRRPIPRYFGQFEVKVENDTHRLSARRHERPAETAPCLSYRRLSQEIALSRRIQLSHRHFLERSTRMMTLFYFKCMRTL